MDSNNIHKMVEKLGEIIYDSIDLKSSRVVILGIITGGFYIAKQLHKYLQTKNVDCKVGHIRVDLNKKVISEGKEYFNKKDSLYLLVDDAVWSSNTKKILVKELKRMSIKNYKYAVFLDPYHKADFSLYSS